MIMEFPFKCLFILLFCLQAYCQTLHRRFEYKYSFKGPYLAQKDNQVPFWNYSGHAIASEESFRITPSLRSQKGQAWTKNPINFDWWEVDIVFRVNGRGRIGADGLAFWYTSAPGVEGPVFGSSDMWNGLGLFFDSFDNDNKRNNPYIMGMVNDGTLVYDHEHDGLSQQLGGCLRDFRNKPFPIRARIEYYKNVLTIYIHSGMTDNEKDYELCLRNDNVFLPAYGYFGVSAATGGLADDHDVLRFLVSSIRSSEEMADMRLSADDEEKFQREFQEYQEKTQKARDDYVAEHPDAAKRFDHPDEEYETAEQRDLRQIYQGQGKIFDVIRQLNVKLDDVVGKQDRTLNVIASVQAGVPPPPPGQPVPQIAALDSIRRHEVDSILNNQREMVQNSRDIKNTVLDIQTKSQTILANSMRAQGSVQPAGAGSYDMHVTLKELNEGLNILKRDLGLVSQRLGPSAGAISQCPTCVSTSILFVFVIGQLVILIGYFIYRDSKEARAKKFY